MYPRPVMVSAGVLDFFPIEGTRRTFREMQSIYTRLRHGDRIAMVESYNGHEYSTENQQAVLDFLDHFNHMPVRAGLPPVKELDGETLQCTRTGQVLLDYSDGRTLTDVIREYYEQHKSGGGRTIAKEYYGDKYGVKNWRVREGAGVLPQAGEIAICYGTAGRWKCPCFTFTSPGANPVWAREKLRCGLGKTAKQRPKIGPTSKKF
jgi:hypothetical protein